MFRLTPASGIREDGMLDYAVTLDKTYTVGEFVRTVLENNPGDWGYISIRDGWTNFGDPVCEYRNGRLRSAMSRGARDKKVASVAAVGGMGRVDYRLALE